VPVGQSYSCSPGVFCSGDIDLQLFFVHGASIVKVRWYVAQTKACECHSVSVFRFLSEHRLHPKALQPLETFNHVVDRGLCTSII